MATGFPALMIKQPESPLEQFAKLQQIRSGQQQMQMQGLQIQQEQQKISDQHALTQAMTQWDGQDVKALPMLVLKAGGSGPAAMQMSSQVLDMRAKASEMAKNDALTGQTNLDVMQKKADARRGTLLSIIGNPDPAAKQSAWDSEVTKEEQAGTIQPNQIPHVYPGDDKAQAFANSMALGSKLADEAIQKQHLSLDAWKPVGGSLVNSVTGEKIGGITDISPLNKGLATRWQVLHPGEAVPDYFQLPTGATPNDFDRIDKLLDSSERAAATVAQQKILDTMRQQTFDLAKDKTDLQAVTGLDPKTGKQVLVPLPQAQQMGIQNPIKAEGQDVQRAMAGRQWLTLAEKQAPDSAPPDEKGIMQLIDSLDKEGKLGPLAGRWNDFMARKFGQGDPEYQALATKMGLSTSLLGQAHAGARGAGSPFLLEHMEDLANAKKMDGPTLKSAFKSEVDYVTDRAMDPNPPNYSQQAKPSAAPAFKAPAGAPTAPKEDGHTLRMNGKDIAVSKGGQWVAP